MGRPSAETVFSVETDKEEDKKTFEEEVIEQKNMTRVEKMFIRYFQIFKIYIIVSEWRMQLDVLCYIGLIVKEWKMH